MDKIAQEIKAPYDDFPFPPVRFAAKAQLNFVQGSIVKYVTRHKKRNGRPDLENAMAYVTLAQETRPENFVPFPDADILLKVYVDLNGLTPFQERVIERVLQQDWLGAALTIKTLIMKEYGR